MRSVKTFCFCIIILFSVSARAESLKSLIEVKELTDKVMAIISLNEYDAAINMIKKYSTIGESEFGVLQSQMKAQAPTIKSSYGDVVKTEFIKQETAGESFVKIIQLSKHEKYALRWIFIFYKPKDAWVLVSFKFDDKIGDLFQ